MPYKYYFRDSQLTRKTTVVDLVGLDFLRDS